MRWKAFRAGLVVFVPFVAVAAACGRSGEPPARPAVPHKAASLVVATSDHAPRPEGSAVAAPASVAPDASAPSEAPVLAEDGHERFPEPPGSTRGTIACRSERCDAKTQACIVEGDTWRCVDGKPEPEGGMLQCDDGTDCGPGLTCCQTGASAHFFSECTKRSGPESNCALELCKPGGARCPQNTRCDDGYCVSDLPVTCPGSGKCKGDEFCEWNAGATSCVKDPTWVSDPVEARGVFGCTRPSDCASGQCCTSMLVSWRQTYCATNCDISNTQFVCQTPADCKLKLLLMPPQFRKDVKLTCKPLEGEGPSWLKLCGME